MAHRERCFAPPVLHSKPAPSRFSCPWAKCDSKLRLHVNVKTPCTHTMAFRRNTPPTRHREERVGRSRAWTRAPQAQGSSLQLTTVRTWHAVFQLWPKHRTEQNHSLCFSRFQKRFGNTHRTLAAQAPQAMSSSLAVWAISAVVAIAAAAPLDCDVCSEQTAEHCSLFPSSPACKTRCGFVWDTATSGCVIEGTEGVTAPLIAKGNGAAPPIIGGQGKYR
jgi:hypothetical protein